MKTRTLAALLCLAPLPAGAYFDAGLNTTFGTNAYRGLDGFAMLGAENGLYVKPRFTAYRSNTTNGTYKTVYGRVGFDQDWLSLGGEVGATPKVGNYSNRSIGGDVTFTLKPGKGREGKLAGPASEERRRKGPLSRVDAGASVTHIRHQDRVPVTATTDLELKTGQTDLGLFGGVEVLSLDLSAQYTRSRYDREIPAVLGPRARARLSRSSASVFGYPDYSWNGRVGFNGYDLLTPWVSYTYTDFRLALPAARSYQAGATLWLGWVGVKGSYEVYDPGGGQAKEKYVSVGATLSF